MDFFTGDKPNLIGSAMQTALNELANKPKINNTISDKIMTSLTNIYTNYIKDYWFIILFLILIVIYLIYRYNNKSEKFEPKQSPKPNEDLITQFKKYQDTLVVDENIHMNPLQSTDQKLPPINYPPDPLPVNIPNEGLIFTKELSPLENPEIPLYYPKDYDYNKVYKNKVSYYTGTHNTYENAEDTYIENPYGWSNNFNTTTGKFVKGMTDANKQTNYDYQTIVDNTNSNLINNLQNHTSQYPIDYIEPPYEK